MHREGLIDQSSTLAVISAYSASSTKQGKDIQDGIERIERSIQSAHSILPVLQRQGEVSSLNLHTVRDDVQSLHRDMKENHTSFSGSFATLKTQFEETSSSTESAILARVDDLARQNLALINALDHLSESSQIRGATLVSSDVSKDSSFLVLILMQESDVKNIQLSLVQKPGLLKETCDEFKNRELDNIAASMTTTSPSRIRMTRTKPFCTCRFRTGSYIYSSSQHSKSRETSWTVSLHSSNRDHHHDCPLSACSESSWRLNFRLAYCSRLLARAVQASISFTKGAGGRSLSPIMNIRCLVANDSPGVALISEPFPRQMSASDIDTVVSQRVQSLRQLFQDGKASPYDVCINGDTLLHVGNSG